MKRRTFLELIGVSGTTLAAGDIQAATSFLEPLEAIDPRIIWKTQGFDFDNQFGMMAQFPDGRRHAILIYERVKDVTPEMQHNMKRALYTWWKEKNGC